MTAQNEENAAKIEYRVKFGFQARSGDELTIQPGDTILIFEGFKSESVILYYV
jgi:hypothetical protein